MPRIATPDDTWSATELSAITGAPVKAVYKAMKERLPRALSVRRDEQIQITRWGAVCFVIDREMPRTLPLSVRRHLYDAILGHVSSPKVSHEQGILSYEIDVKAVADRIDRDLARYRRAMRLIVEDAAIQGGAATFRGTRILVHQIAALLAQGADEEELRADYPRLTRAMIEAAPIYARAHPRRGRPRKPAWRTASDAPRRG